MRRLWCGKSSRGRDGWWKTHPWSCGVVRTDSGRGQRGLKGVQSMRDKNSYGGPAVGVLLLCSTKEKLLITCTEQDLKDLSPTVVFKTDAQRFNTTPQRECDFSTHNRSCQPHFPTESLCDVFLFYFVNYCSVMYFLSPVFQTDTAGRLFGITHRLILFNDANSETFE